MLYSGLSLASTHFYKVTARFPLIGDPTLEILHLNAFQRHVS
jgi:hypothetical protein